MIDLEKLTKKQLIDTVVDIKKEFHKANDAAIALEEIRKHLEEVNDEHIQFLRELVGRIGDHPGVLEGEKDEPETEPKKYDLELKSELADAMKKLEALEEKDKARDDVAKAEYEADKLQSRLEPVLAVLLEAEDYAPFAELIRAEITDKKDGNIKAEDENHLYQLVKVALEKINEIRSIEVKRPITTDVEKEEKRDGKEEGKKLVKAIAEVLNLLGFNISNFSVEKK